MEGNEIRRFYTIGIIGGTGKEGKGLAYRWAKAGYTIYLGSRVQERAVQVASDLGELLQGKLTGKIIGMENHEAAQKADVVVLTVPYNAHRETLVALREDISGKILIDVTVPLVPPKVTRVQMPPEGSAAQAVQAILGPSVQVVSAFQNISYEHLLHNEQVDCDVLVCGGSKVAKQVVLELIRAAGLTGWDAGPIENSMVVEGLTSILIGINKQYGTQSAGIRITGVPRD